MRKRSVILNGHSTSVSLEDAYWEEVRAMAAREGVPVAALIERIDRSRQGGNLSSAIRIAVLDDYRARIAAAE
jgi:predicted DNA-binding ribbon-helix-helix protein